MSLKIKKKNQKKIETVVFISGSNIAPNSLNYSTDGSIAYIMIKKARKEYKP
tara:strand:+ start:59 stop:214 length:156 start_codon:yes stop_codon:yes gene_type:complete